jgi:hypothetical protein
MIGRVLFLWGDGARFRPTWNGRPFSINTRAMQHNNLSPRRRTSHDAMAIPGQQTTTGVGVGCRAAAVLQPASRHRQELGWLGGRGDRLPVGDLAFCCLTIRRRGHPSPSGPRESETSNKTPKHFQPSGRVQNSTSDGCD